MTSKAGHVRPTSPRPPPARHRPVQCERQRGPCRAPQRRPVAPLRGARLMALPTERADHILIVDDDREIRELLATYLRKNGFDASVAANGRQMRAALDDGGVDLVVLDLMLPGEDGLLLCRELRAGKW